MRKLAVLGVLLLSFIVVPARAAELPRTPDSNSAAVAMRHYLNLISTFGRHFDKLFIREFAGEWQREIIPSVFDGRPSLRIRLNHLRRKGDRVSLIATIPEEDEIPYAVSEVIDELKRLIKIKTFF